MKTIIGGNRLGSGKKMETELHGYERSTFNLNKIWRSTMAVGTLVPCYINIGLNGDTFDIDVNSIVRTIPTKAPIFGTFKMQIDFFKAGMRLWNGKLHNNPTDVALNMNDIKMQSVDIHHNLESDTQRSPETCQINGSALLRYLGMSGYGCVENGTEIVRNINALPILTYYDIVKNYYTNKQEGVFYWISGISTEQPGVLNSAMVGQKGWQPDHYQASNNVITFPENYMIISNRTIYLFGSYLNNKNLYLRKENSSQEYSFDYLITNGYIIKKDNEYNSDYAFQWVNRNIMESAVRYQILVNGQGIENEIMLNSTEIKKLDLVREACLLSSDFVKEYGNIENMDFDKIVNLWGQGGFENPFWDLPNFSCGDLSAQNIPNNSIYTMYGLCLKTYQNDMFNNWLSNTIVDTSYGKISEITKIDTTDGLNLDILTLNKKVYNMLNRLAVTGGTYEDWQEVNYGEKVMKLNETPIYVGGTSYEVGFEEVVSTSDTMSENDKTLGSLAGKGTIINGGNNNHIIIHVDEPCIIMGIVSLTPRIDYSQGNKWYLTELKNYGQLHVPALDNIAFQDLMQEELAWFGYGYRDVDGEKVEVKESIGKLPAWMHYMTDVNEVFGDFVDNEKAGYMVLKRNYQFNQLGSILTQSAPTLQDITTYIEPEKFNYAFAYTGLDAQNFWVQIGLDIKARRKMSAKIIPNL